MLVFWKLRAGCQWRKGGMCTLCNVFMFNTVLREQSQTSFHGGVLFQYMCSFSF